MARETWLDEKTGRKCFFDLPDDYREGEEVTFILNLHGGGSSGAWQRMYFPAHDYVNDFRLVIAAPSAATKEPMTRWVGEADDDHLHNIVEHAITRFGPANIKAFWLVGHSQGGMTSNRLLSTDEFFSDRVDGWLSLSGGRLGQRAEMAANFGPPRPPGTQRMRPAGFEPPPAPTADFSFIYATGEHEIVSLPEASPWAEKLGAGARERRPDVVDDQPGQIHDGRWDDNPTLSWGRKPRPGTAQVWVYPGARDGRVVADVVRLDKGHTEGLEPNITRALLELLTSAPGGKIAELEAMTHGSR